MKNVFTTELCAETWARPRLRAALVLGFAAAVAILATGPGKAWAGDIVAPGNLIISSSAYQGANNSQGTPLQTGNTLPNNPNAPGQVTTPVKAVDSGSYPYVFCNNLNVSGVCPAGNGKTIDGNFGVTSAIDLNSYATTLGGQGQVIVGGNDATMNVTSLVGVTTSFSSKSELAINLSANDQALTFVGYDTSAEALDISNSNTPGVVDPTNTDTAPNTYRTVVQVNANNSVETTNTNAYSGNNGRAAILVNNVDGTKTNEYVMVGNAGNGSGTPPNALVQDTGVQLIGPGSSSPNTTVVGAHQGTVGASKGSQYGYSVVQNGYTADKSGKDNNYRGETIFDNTLYVTKGSGSNGIDTVYQVHVPGGGLPDAANASQATFSILPGFNTVLASSASNQFYPFGLFFANADTLYVGDEGPQSLSGSPYAALEKWSLVNGTWKLDYTLQNGLNLDQSYSVSGLPSALDPATTGLRNIAGYVRGNTVTIFGVTSTYSNSGDPGADPNEVVEITDNLAATSLPNSESFSTIEGPVYGNVYRGVAYDAAPEPSTWAMMALGFVGLGWAGFRRSAKTKAAAA